jgi:hypothetical protein
MLHDYANQNRGNTFKTLAHARFEQFPYSIIYEIGSVQGFTVYVNSPDVTCQRV